jgi:hypothetical protein
VLSPQATIVAAETELVSERESRDNPAVMKQMTRYSIFFSPPPQPPFFLNPVAYLEAAKT